jgi:sulfatase modifying factor 1
MGSAGSGAWHTGPVSDIEMARIAAGTVALHDARLKRRWSVELEPFEIGVDPVTQEQLAELIGESASHPRRPATDVSWLRAIRFCNAASEWEGLDPAYTFEGEDVTWHVDADGYRLPTEAEWEYACRAGSTAPQYGPLAEIAWTSADGVTSPQNVGGRMPNLNGLFDTLGNVWEWCWDLLDPARYGDYRVFRGGGFADDAWSVRASTRRGGGPRMHHDDVGFRVARGGFDDVDAAQGWSAAADRERAEQDGPLPPGWTPRR